MFFPFQCQTCKNQFDGDYPIGKAPRTTECPECQGKSKRVYSGYSIGVSVSGVTHPSSFGEQMKARNVEAGVRMQGNKPPVRLAGYKYDNGKVEEAH